MNAYFYYLYNSFIRPKLENEDLRRREWIFNIIIAGSVVLSGVAFFSALYSEVHSRAGYRGMPLLILFSFFLIFGALLFLSRKGFFVISSYIFIGIFLLPITYAIYKWGIDLPQALLSYALIIAIAGILINSRFAIFVTVAVATIIIVFGYLQNSFIIIPNLYWKKEMLRVYDAVVIATTFGAIALVFWLSNREMEKSLIRARKSERELQEERDLLEVKVEERTRELKAIQLEKISQLYNFSEFGRLASGLFHDMMNNLTAVTLNLEYLKKNDDKKFVDADLKKLFNASKKMENFMSAVRKQIQNQEINSLFSLKNEIQDVAQILNYKAKTTDIELKFLIEGDIKTYGNPLKFNQLAANLISNAIDSYEQIDKTDKRKRQVIIKLSRYDNMADFSVKDFGSGILKENIDKIFDPFFTTKISQGGTGIGLASVKEIVEKNFSGNIKVESIEGQGSIFKVQFPIKGGQ